jgi:CheY-like chemotaxis protein
MDPDQTDPNPVILLVEDDPDDIYLVLNAFEDHDPPVRIITIEDGESAQAYLSGASPYHDRDEHPLPDLVLLDIRLPRMNGLELLEWMKGTTELDTIPVYLLSSGTEHHEVQRGYRLGAHAYLPKDGDIHRLEALAAGIAAYAAHHAAHASTRDRGRLAYATTSFDPPSENAA